MKELVQQWFEQSAPFEGILACGVRHPDRTSVTKAWADGFSDFAIENALRCASELFQVLPLNRLPQGRVRWSYQQAVLHCERRADGICLGIFTTPNHAAYDVVELERMFREFRALANAVTV